MCFTVPLGGHLSPSDKTEESKPEGATFWRWLMTCPPWNLSSFTTNLWGMEGARTMVETTLLPYLFLVTICFTYLLYILFQVWSVTDPENKSKPYSLQWGWFKCLMPGYGVYMKCTTKRLTYWGLGPSDNSVQEWDFEGCESFNWWLSNTIKSHPGKELQWEPTSDWSLGMSTGMVLS